MQRKDIAHGEKTFERGLLNALRQVGSCLAGECKHLHTKTACETCYLHSDAAKAYNTHGLTCKFDKWCIPIHEIGIGTPSAITVLLGIMLHPVGHGKYVGKCHLNNTIGAVSRYVGDKNVEIGCCVNIHDIISSGKYTNILQSRQ